jgi:hypothetical protein
MRDTTPAYDLGESSGPGTTSTSFQPWSENMSVEVHWLESIWQGFHARQQRPAEFEPSPSPPLADKSSHE